MSRFFSNAIALPFIFALSCVVMALDSVPRPSPRPERPLTIYDLELKVDSKLPILPNKRNAKQTTYRPRSGVESSVRILESRRGMYLIALYEDGHELPGKYLISHKWADRILDVDAVLKVAQMNKIIEEATSPVTSAENCPPAEDPSQGATNEDEEADSLDQEQVAQSLRLELDQGIVSALGAPANKVSCMKHSSRDSELSEGLYDSLVTVFAMKECAQKIVSIRSKIPSKAAFPIESISSCAIELDFLTRDQSEGDLEVTLENGEQAILKWSSQNGAAKSQSEWLYGKEGETGLMAQEGFAKICPSLALNQNAAGVNPENEEVVTLSQEITEADEPESVSLQANIPRPRARPERSSGVILPTNVPRPRARPERSSEVILPTNVPRPRARPEQITSVSLPENIPTPMARPEGLAERYRQAASASSSKPLCEMRGVSEQWVKNCEALYRAGIPKDALEYALKVMQLNDDSFESNKCYKTGPSGHYSMRGVSKADFERKMSGGLPNKCQMVINDTRDKLGTYRGRMYYIDLCSGSAPKVVKSYFNMGTGTFKNSYADRGGAHTTVKGAFFTNYKTFSFQKNNSAYQAVKSRVKSLSGTYKAPSVQLFGLSTTNNEAGPNLKYMHVSGYKSSWGCPSISPDNYWMIEKLANNGPSLVLNYGTGMEDIRKCSK